MATDSDEDERLRSAALQNAQSILLARKQAEEDLIRAKEILEEKTAALERNAIENTKLLRALRESDRRKDEFLAMLAHELRNPLAPIANATQIVRALPGPTPELTWAMDVIERQLHQMTRLVDDLLDVSRLNEGRIELRKESVEVATLVEMAVEVCRPLFHDRGHDLRLDVPAESIPLDVDPTRLTQVLLNLLTNAAKCHGPPICPCLSRNLPSGPVLSLRRGNGDQPGLVDDWRSALRRDDQPRGRLERRLLSRRSRQ
jgi:signal transduction histidine kinase